MPRSSVRVQRSSESVRRSSAEGCGVAKLGCSGAQLGCGKAQLKVRRSSVGSAWACCKTGPSLNLGSAPQGPREVFPAELTAMRRRREISANGDA